MDTATPASGFHMADVRRKRPSERRAVAVGELHAGPVGYAALAGRTLPKGDALAMAEVAGLQGAKQASQLMPLCHPLSLEYVDVRCVPVPERHAIRVYCEASLTAKTGVEMEALAGASAALLTLYDLTKPVEPALRIEAVRLLFKEGGKKGLWIHPDGMDEAERAHYRPRAGARLDGERVAKTVGFDGVCQNSLDAVSDRDFALEFAGFASITMVHISRLAEEIVLWMSQNFGFIDLADRYCTGSSIMPQKRNPDVAELARGKSGRVVGHLMGLITLMKGQPLTYNKDNQEDKEPLFDTVDTLRDTLRIMAEMVGGITVKKEAMEHAALRGYATATDLADYLVKKGLPFRDAHEVVAHAVKTAIAEGKDLSELPLATLQGFNAAITDDVYGVLSLAGSLNARQVLGGTAPAQVRAQIARHRTRLA